MAHYKASDHKREQFRRYLEKTGVVDSLTTVNREVQALVRLLKLPSAGNETNNISSIHIKHWFTALVALYEQPEKPSDALEFVKQHLITGLTLADTEALQQEVNEMRQKCECLEAENKDLKERLQQYDVTPEDEAAAD